MMKALRKAIMKRLELETKYFRLKTKNTLKAYKKAELLQQTIQKRKKKVL